uniref:Uncharacterized protein n=1 Tax=Lotus japonicus TaxID=34305 RepID=I3ST53_LOTJA|nr:unknown [Lotus japonicus]
MLYLGTLLICKVHNHNIQTKPTLYLCICLCECCSCNSATSILLCCKFLESVIESILFCKNVQKRQCLGHVQLKTELGAIIVVKDGPEGILLKWLTNFPSKHLYLSRETRFTRALLVFPGRWINVSSSKTCSLKDSMELVSGIVVKK